ncbi:hypothetical protein G8764_19295 [Pseudomaricurvus alcaniphilus]|uniref:hypothetical protein n=1 Tax=Pseudomaricurvus alcaniphilus TaxID=1166482 RepID=UPI0014091E1B|nr:hypothetical protein [Pseudomaricurvus alcaniphilus]NHN39457.1 hypothetical protein [Pseudomaricurvus alcaniphilus]
MNGLRCQKNDRLIVVAGSGISGGKKLTAHGRCPRKLSQQGTFNRVVTNHAVTNHAVTNQAVTNQAMKNQISTNPKTEVIK